MRMTPIAKMAPIMSSGAWMQDLSFDDFEFGVGMKVHTAAEGCFSQGSERIVAANSDAILTIRENRIWNASALYL